MSGRAQPRGRAPAGLALALALVALLPALALLPSAAADHVYSHRFVFEGRVVTADGVAAANRTVEFSSTDPRIREPCAEGPHQAVTDEWGDFHFCFHIHDLDHRATASVSVGNSSVERVIDTAFRRTVVTLVLDENATSEDSEAAPASWDETFRVAGKVWRRGSVTLEGVPVYGVALTDTPVNVTVRTPDGEQERHELLTDGYGDFDLTLVLDEGVDPREVRVELETMGTAQGRRLDPFSHRTTVGFFLPSENVAPVSATFQDEPSDEAEPGTRTPAIHPVLILALGLGAWGMVAVAKNRRREK